MFSVIGALCESTDVRFRLAQDSALIIRALATARTPYDTVTAPREQGSREKNKKVMLLSIVVTPALDIVTKIVSDRPGETKKSVPKDQLEMLLDRVLSNIVQLSDGKTTP